MAFPIASTCTARGDLRGRAGDRASECDGVGRPGRVRAIRMLAPEAAADKAAAARLRLRSELRRRDAYRSVHPPRYLRVIPCRRVTGSDGDRLRVVAFCAHGRPRSGRGQPWRPGYPMLPPGPGADCALAWRGAARRPPRTVATNSTNRSGEARIRMSIAQQGHCAVRHSGQRRQCAWSGHRTTASRGRQTVQAPPHRGAATPRGEIRADRQNPRWSRQIPYHWFPRSRPGTLGRLWRRFG